MAEIRASSPRSIADPKPDGFAAGGRQAASPVLAFALLIMGAFAAIFLAGGADQGNLGVFLLCAGAVLIACPPLAPVRRGAAGLAAAFLACEAAALLPARFFPVPVWRQALGRVPDLPLPGAVSAVPAQTFFWWTVLALTVATGFLLLTQPVRSRSLLNLALVGAGLCGLYAALSIFAKLSGWKYPFTGEASFGFLPNRNHTATLLITGSILAVGIVSTAFRQRSWLTLDAAVVVLTLCVTALFFFSESRAGVVFLFIGTGIWLGGLGSAHRDRRLLVAVGLILLTGGGLFLAIKSEARDRLFRAVPTFSPVGPPTNTAMTAPLPRAVPRAGEITTDDRLRIYRDTARLIGDVPWTGTGLGTFALVFPFYRQSSAGITLVLHPESDWLMVAAEAGLPALLCLGALVGWVLLQWRPDRTHPYWPLRWAALVAAGTAALHGLVDVPAHRAAVGWWVLTLAGLALQPGRSRVDAVPTGKATLMARLVYVAAGLLALTLGFQLIRAQWFSGSALPPFAAKRQQAEIVHTFEQGNKVLALEQARHAVQTSPLAAPLYYQLGVMALWFEDTDAEVDRAFRIQRLLTPWSPEVPWTQGLVWLPIDPARTTTLFTEALTIQEELPPDAPGKQAAASYFKGLVGRAAGLPAAQVLLWKIAVGRGSEFMLAWLEAATLDAVKPQFTALAADEQFLTRLDASQRGRFVDAWLGRGDGNALQTFLNARGAEWRVNRQGPP